MFNKLDSLITPTKNRTFSERKFFHTFGFFPEELQKGIRRQQALFVVKNTLRPLASRRKVVNAKAHMLKVQHALRKYRRVSNLLQLFAPHMISKDMQWTDFNAEFTRLVKEASVDDEEEQQYSVA